ncbi:MAG: alpha/beta hydrolase [Ornithinimicrobium sp.]
MIDNHRDTTPLTRSAQAVADDGVQLHVEIDEPVEAAVDQGDATVVLCHGYTLDRRSWTFQREACVAAGYRVLAWDQRGHGKSGKGEAGHYTIDQLGRDLASVLVQCVPAGPVVLVGHSMGGMAIMALADSHPGVVADRVVAVGFISSSSGDMEGVTWGLGARLGTWVNGLGPRLATRAAPYQARLQALWNRMPWLGNEMVAASSFGSAVSRSTAQLTERMMVETDFEVISDFAPTLQEHDKKSVIPAFAGVPALVLVGDRDVLTPADRSAALAAHLPFAEHVVVTRAGHNIMLEHPELISDYILRLVRRAESGGHPHARAGRVRSTDVRPGRGRRALTLGAPA